MKAKTRLRAGFFVPIMPGASGFMSDPCRPGSPPAATLGRIFGVRGRDRRAFNLCVGLAGDASCHGWHSPRGTDRRPRYCGRLHRRPDRRHGAQPWAPAGRRGLGSRSSLHGPDAGFFDRHPRLSLPMCAARGLLHCRQSLRRRDAWHGEWREAARAGPAGARLRSRNDGQPAAAGPASAGRISKTRRFSTCASATWA